MVGDHLQHCCYREQFAYALYSKFREPRLYRMAVTGDWDDIPDRCRTHPKEAMFVHKYAPNDTALHRILRQVIMDGCQQLNLDEAIVSRLEEIKHTAVQALLQAYPKAASLSDAFGRYPLHLACMNASSESVILLLLETNPRAACASDVVEKRLPLHYLLARNQEISEILLKSLIEEFPGSVKQQDTTGETPVDLVRRRLGELKDGKAILKLLEQAAEETN